MLFFAGALWEEERDRMYQSADLVVMPSVSEPFGLVPLEALQHGTPSLITYQSGVGEVLSHVLKVDFGMWMKWLIKYFQPLSIRFCGNRLCTKVSGNYIKCLGEKQQKKFITFIGICYNTLPPSYA